MFIWCLRLGMPKCPSNLDFTLPQQSFIQLFWRTILKHTLLFALELYKLVFSIITTITEHISNELFSLPLYVQNDNDNEALQHDALALSLGVGVVVGCDVRQNS